MRVGGYDNHSTPRGYNPAAYVPPELDFRRGTARKSGEPLESNVRKEWKPIGKVVNVDDRLYSMMETSLGLYTVALKGSDGSLVNDIGTDLEQAFDSVLLIIGGDAFGKSPFGGLHRKYQRINERYIIKPQQMKYTGIAAMVATPP